MSNLFNLFKKKKDDEIEFLDDETKFERILRHLKKKIRRCNKLKLAGFVFSFLIICLFNISLFTGKNIVSVGVRKVLNNAGIYTKVIDSVDISSSVNNDEGSWSINKSAKWTSSNTAEVVFDIDSVRKTNDNKKDIILVLDISGSMLGDKITKVLSDTKELINDVLSNEDNRIALITFDSSSTILSTFTNDKDTLIDKLDKIEVTGCTNYNAALKNVNSVMDGYVKEKGRDVVTLFLTDGYPNEETPNQIGAYDVLKDKYPYMDINGVQYEMGKDIINEIKEISDEQWSADQTTLNNVLFEAAVSPLRYEEYIVSDYISDEFKVNSESDIEVSLGKVSLSEENGLQKITWNLGNSKYATGSNAKMTIKLTLKEDKTEETLIPTNKKESITYKLEDENEKTVNSSDTPVLKNMYNVIYDTNAPDGCELESIDSEKQGVYKTVTKKTKELSCEGYLFKGWEMDEEDAKDATSIGSDYFIMPAHDVTIRATWTKQSITKTMDGTVHEKTTLYKVLKNEAETGTYAKEYTGSHQDSMDKSKSTQKIYYWYASNDTNANTILNKNNVIFAGQCWQMIRTTDTGGVKMIYNGEAEDGKCLSTRGTHVGYSYATTKSLNTTYYYGTSYKYDSTAKSFSLSGTITTGSIKTGQYTCLNTSQKGTCTTLYYVDTLSSGTTYNVIPLNTSSAYSQFGTLQFNKNYSSPADVGYMYNTRYTYNFSSSSEYVYTLSSLSTNYWYADSVTYSNGRYTLNNPYKVSSTTDYANLVGKYTFTSSTENYTSSSVRYIGYAKESSVYYKVLSGGSTTSNDTYTYGSSYTDNGDGTYTINSPTTISWKDYYTNYSSISGKYVCKNANNNTCSELWYTTSTGNTYLNYGSTKNKYIYGNSFTYTNGKYKLNDTKTYNDLEVYSDKTKLNNYHYTCLDETGECTTLSYVYYISGGTKYYIKLTNGKSVEDALNEMLSESSVNTNNSTMKSGVDAWYESTLSNYSDYIEDTIYCNDRSISQLGGWNPNGGSVSSILYFKNYNLNDDLSCTNETDKFSTENEKAKLKYKVGLMTSSEMYLLNNYTLRKTGNYYWLASPSYFYYNYADGRFVYSGGLIDYSIVNFTYGVRPAVSLTPGTEYTSGEGSMESPYIIEVE